MCVTGIAIWMAGSYLAQNQCCKELYSGAVRSGSESLDFYILAREQQVWHVRVPVTLQYGGEWCMFNMRRESRVYRWSGIPCIDIYTAAPSVIHTPHFHNSELLRLTLKTGCILSCWKKNCQQSRKLISNESSTLCRFRYVTSISTISISGGSELCRSRYISGSLLLDVFRGPLYFPTMAS